MKKLSLFLFVLLLVFASCSKDNGYDNGGIKFIQIKTSFDSDGRGPEGKIFVFYLDNVKVSDFTPHFSTGGDVCTLYDVNNEYVFPIYDRKSNVDQDSNTGKYINLSTSSIYTNQLSSTYGTPKPSGNYLIVLRINLAGGGYSYTYKQVKFENIYISKTFKRNPTLEESRFYDKWD